MLEFNLTNEKLILFSAKAPQVKHLIDAFISEIKKAWRPHTHTHIHVINDWQFWKSSCSLFSLQDSDYVIAERNFVTEDHSMLRFHKGDIIRLQVMDGLEKGETLYYL